MTQPGPAPRAEHLQAVTDRYQAERRLPSLVTGLLDPGLPSGLGWTGAAGSPATSDTQFRIGSITKTLTAVLVLQCRDEGLLSLDDPLGRFVPEAGRYAAATVRGLLSHTAGMQSEPAGPWWERSPGGTVAQLLAANDGSGAVFEPGTHHHYSNLGYGLLGEVVARVRGASWRTLVSTRVLEPLGLRRTSYAAEAPAATGWSVHHLAGTLVPEPAHDTGAMAPAGQLWSTVEDLARFGGFLLDGHPDVLDAPTLREMRQPVAPATEYGLGVRVAPYAAGLLVGHTGSMPGFQSALLVDPVRRTGVVALTNATTGFSGTELAGALLGPRTPGRLDPWVPARQVPAWALELLGTWHWGSSAYEVRWHADRLEWRDLARGLAIAEQFTRAPDGRIVGEAGYHHGETLHVVRREDGSVLRLECATFVYTREPYRDDADHSPTEETAR
ncbi:CubicO group peptidase, beta-lactamase class C family [Nocardioides scoriae]|uniref:CubicO group peptidase, beta-lactamase class C family n=1 Tax=Nocardioides scoriae TaxID=642780 RepID=A0A1H1NUD2_9ACTN|nr:serine hydrolase domain-containing protein [Nocardioides scoriae]SDS02365.1 CubicO group peptidase, beta-lactamase class C family [Nocardioides scoriae]